MTLQEKKEKKWFPLESNPDTINKYVKKLGYPIESYCFYDILSTEDWGLAMIPKPILAVLFLFPIKEHSEQYRKEEEERINREGQILNNSVYFMKQKVGNACGTIGILHAIANSRNAINFEKESVLDKLLKVTINLTPDERAEALEGSDEIERDHETAAQQGQTETGDKQEEINSHFICFSLVEGFIYELDGRKKFPINHGKSSQDDFLQNACKVIHQFMERDEGEVRFTILALAAAN